MPVTRPKVAVDLLPYYVDEERAQARKDMVVLHETISPDYPGLVDITGPARYMDTVGLEIHCVVDADGNSGWAGNANWVYDHCGSRGTKGNGHVNTRSVGIEQVSRIPTLPSRLRLPAWRKRRRQLDTVAHWCAWLHQTEHIPLEYSDGKEPGITTHWQVSQTFGVPHGHWDCWPAHLGGHYPALYVIQKARNIVRDAGAV